MEGLFQDLIQQDTDLGWIIYSVVGEEQSPDVLLGCRSLFSPTPRVWGEYYSKEQKQSLP